MDFFKSLLIIILSGILFSMILQIAFNLKAYLLDLKAYLLERKIKKLTKGLLPKITYGECCDMDFKLDEIEADSLYRVNFRYSDNGEIIELMTKKIDKSEINMTEDLFYTVKSIAPLAFRLDSLIYSSANKKVSFAVMPELIFKDKNEVTLVIKKSIRQKDLFFQI